MILAAILLDVFMNTKIEIYGVKAVKRPKIAASKKLDLSKSQLFWPSLSRLGIDASFDVCCSATDRALHDSPYSVAYINFFSGFHNY